MSKICLFVEFRACQGQRRKNTRNKLVQIVFVLTNTKSVSNDVRSLGLTLDDVGIVEEWESALMRADESYLSFVDDHVDVFHHVHDPVQPIDVLLAYDLFVE